MLLFIVQILFFGFANVLVLVFVFEKYISRFHKLCNKIPGASPWPVLGNAHYFINVPPERNLEVIGSFKKQYGDIYRIWLGNEVYIFLWNEKYIKQVLSEMEFSSKSDSYRMMEPWLHEGLLISKGLQGHNNIF